MYCIHYNLTERNSIKPEDPDINYEAIDDFSFVANMVGDVDQINHRIRKGLSPRNPDLAPDKDPANNFLISTFRGVHYNTKLWDDESREVHSGIDEVSKHQFSASVLVDSFGSFANYIAAIRDNVFNSERLLARARALRNKFQQLKQSGLVGRRVEVELVDEEGKKTGEKEFRYMLFNGRRDEDVYDYSSDFDGNAARRKEAEFQKKYLLNAANPHLSAAAILKHPLLYASAHKTYSGAQRRVTLQPEYDQNGIPRYPFVGKLYTFTHSVAEIKSSEGPTDVMHKTLSGKIPLSSDIANEREMSFLGYIDSEAVNYQHLFEFPAFDGPYNRDVHYVEFGLDEQSYNICKRAFTKNYYLDSFPSNKKNEFVAFLESTGCTNKKEAQAIIKKVNKAKKKFRVS